MSLLLMGDPMSFTEPLAASAVQLNVLGVAGILVWHLIPRRRANARLIAQLAFFGLMALMLARSEIAPLSYDGAGPRDAEALLVTTAKILWWVHLAWAVIGLVRIYLVLNGKPHEARLMQDVIIGLVYSGMGLSVLTFVFGVPIGPLVATSGVVAIILGLALQSTLGDVFSGIALGLGRPFELWDWIVLSDGTEGRVVKTDWRSTHLLTMSHNVVVLPNSSLAKLGLTNISGPDESHGLSLSVRLVPTKMPAILVDAMRTALASCNSILKDPAPTVAVKNIDAAMIELELSFRVERLDQRITARNEIFDLVYRHAGSMGLRLARPNHALLASTGPPDDYTVTGSRFDPVDLIKAIPVFAMLGLGGQEALATAITVRTYRGGDIIVRQGATSPALMIVRTGVVVRQIEGSDGRLHDSGFLSPGDIFGETSMLDGTGELFTWQAVSHVVIYAIDRRDLAPLLLGRPEFAADLATMRSASLPASATAGAPDRQHATTKSSLLTAIESVLHSVPFGRD